MPYQQSDPLSCTRRAALWDAIDPSGACTIPGAPSVRAAAFDVVVVAASLGGPAALEQLLGALPADFAAPILVAQHVAERSPGHLPELLARRTPLAVRHAAAGEPLRGGTVYVAPPGRHLLVEADGRSTTGRSAVRCALADGPRVNFARPSADRLFASAAAAVGARALGVVLTGRLFDSAAGAAAIRGAGGVVLAQDPATCRAPGMPQAALQRGGVDLALPPAALAPALVALVMVPGVPAMVGLGRRAAA